MFNKRLKDELLKEIETNRKMIQKICPHIDKSTFRRLGGPLPLEGPLPHWIYISRCHICGLETQISLNEAREIAAKTATIMATDELKKVLDNIKGIDDIQE